MTYPIKVRAIKHQNEVYVSQTDLVYWITRTAEILKERNDRIGNTGAEAMKALRDSIEELKQYD